MQESLKPQVQSLGREDFLEEGMATQSSILVWRIPWTEKTGRLQSMGLQRLGHNQSKLAQHSNKIMLLRNIKMDTKGNSLKK